MQDQDRFFGRNEYFNSVIFSGDKNDIGKILKRFMGLKTKNLFQNQDLNATIDARSIYCSAMALTFETDFEKLKRQVFWNDPLIDFQDKLFEV